MAVGDVLVWMGRTGQDREIRRESAAVEVYMPGPLFKEEFSYKCRQLTASNYWHLGAIPLLLCWSNTDLADRAWVMTATAGIWGPAPFCLRQDSCNGHLFPGALFGFSKTLSHLHCIAPSCLPNFSFHRCGLCIGLRIPSCSTVPPLIFYRHYTSSPQACTSTPSQCLPQGIQLHTEGQRHLLVICFVRLHGPTGTLRDSRFIVHQFKHHRAPFFWQELCSVQWRIKLISDKITVLQEGSCLGGKTRPIQNEQMAFRAPNKNSLQEIKTSRCAGRLPLKDETAVSSANLDIVSRLCVCIKVA